MNITESIKKGVETRDFRLLYRITEELRLRHRLGYQSTQKWFAAATGMDEFEFEGLMQELDHWSENNEI